MPLSQKQTQTANSTNASLHLTTAFSSLSACKQPSSANHSDEHRFNQLHAHGPASTAWLAFHAAGPAESSPYGQVGQELRKHGCRTRLQKPGLFHEAVLLPAGTLLHTH